jgi:hypothetical protein
MEKEGILTWDEKKLTRVGGFNQKPSSKALEKGRMEPESVRNSHGTESSERA